ncbi:MAG: putative metalloprotease CJM1_0395 family protein [Gammaproteobacteria bacterium]|nr:putative metalloprotease CJM1_0395 family protein [Gammaproteobacteria bacterium]
MISTSNELSTTRPLSSIPPERVSVSNSSTSKASSDQEKQASFDQARLDESRILQLLRARDREVRAHEAAHIAAGREYIRGGPNYTLQQGPDGRSYAIGGEVHLDASPIPNDPEATLTKAEIVRRAALAPAEPSPQDVQVASNASSMAARARIDLAIQRRNEAEQNSNQQQDVVNKENSSSISAFQVEEDRPSIFSQYA